MIMLSLKKKKANEGARQLKVQAAEKTKHQATESTNEKKRYKENFQAMILGMLKSMKQTVITEHNTTINSIQYQVQLNKEYHNDDYRRRIRSLLLLARKTDSVYCDVCHLYSLQKLITPEDIGSLYPVNLKTRLNQHLTYQTCWIQHTQLAINDSLNRAKKDITYPIWSAITGRYDPKQTEYSAAVSCALNNLHAKTTCSIKCMKKNLHVQVNHAMSLALFLAIFCIDKCYSIGWHVLASYDQYGDGWHK